VRHALTLLFGQMAQEGRVVLVPSDVYPVYEHIAQRAGLEYQTYPTYGEGEIPVNDTHDVVLITDPVKPADDACGLGT
jgi:aspartate/methionine/tyrosine aminotransferase